MDGDQSWTVDLDLTFPEHLDAYAYWSARKPSVGLLPSRQDLDPLEMPRTLLPWVNLIEVHLDGDSVRYRHRLVGTGIVDMRNRDGTGCWFEDLYDDERLARLYLILDEVVRNCQPRIVQDDLGNTGRAHRTLQSLVLPLASDGVTVDMLMAVAHYD